MGTAKAQGAKAIQEAITGNEELGDLRRPQQALAQFYRAFNSRDLKMIDDNFAASDDVAIDNPLGGIRRGADEPHKMYESVFKSPANVHVVFWDYTIHRAGDVFWAVGRERHLRRRWRREGSQRPHDASFSAYRRSLAPDAPSRFDRGREAPRRLSERGAISCGDDGKIAPRRDARFA
jgi:hypothetical protein